MTKLIAFILTGVMLIATPTVFAQTVYATKNGKKYHQAECPMISKRSPAAISMEDATKKGLKPCGKCFKEGAKNVSTNNPKLVGNK